MFNLSTLWPVKLTHKINHPATVKNMKRQVIITVEIFAKHTSGKSPEYIKNYQKENNPIKNWAKDLNRHFTKGDVYISQINTWRYSTPPVIRKPQI